MAGALEQGLGPEGAQAARSLSKREQQQDQGQRLAWYAWFMAPKGEKANRMLDNLGHRRNQPFLRKSGNLA
jgi:hypothetical protein